jgi:hypothetical protein
MKKLLIACITLVVACASEPPEVGRDEQAASWPAVCEVDPPDDEACLAAQMADVGPDLVSDEDVMDWWEFTLRARGVRLAWMNCSSCTDGSATCSGCCLYMILIGQEIQVCNFQEYGSDNACEAYTDAWNAAGGHPDGWTCNSTRYDLIL